MRTHVEKKLKEYLQQGNRHTPKDILTQNTGKKEKSQSILVTSYWVFTVYQYFIFHYWAVSTNIRAIMNISHALAHLTS